MNQCVLFDCSNATVHLKIIVHLTYRYSSRLSWPLALPTRAVCHFTSLLSFHIYYYVVIWVTEVLCIVVVEYGSVITLFSEKE